MSGEDENDGDFVRVPTSELPTIRLRHVRSQRDLSVASTEDGPPTETVVAGTTEWLSTWQDFTVTAGWDWCVLQGVVVLLRPTHIRTNVLLVRADGLPEHPLLAQIHVFQWIESQPWRTSAIYSLLTEES